MSSRFSCRIVVLGLGLVGLLEGVPLRAAPPVVKVAKPVERVVTDYENFGGRLEAVQTVALRPRVSGMLEKVHFKAGSEVKQGELLFEIDPRLYQLLVDKAQAELASVEARRKLVEADYARAQKLFQTKALSQEDLDRIVSRRTEAEAALLVARISLDHARLNLDFTRIRAPIHGKIGEALLSPGNQVFASEDKATLLATIVSLDPIYVCFDVSEQTLLRLQRLLRADKGKSDAMPLLMALPGEEGFAHKGVLDFVDNRVDAKTGTIRVRGTFPNPDRLLLPGLSARVRVPMSKPVQALLVTHDALSSDELDRILKKEGVNWAYSFDQLVVNNKPYLLVLTGKNKVEKRSVTVGKAVDGMWVIEKGLKPGDLVVISDIRRLQPGETVEPQIVPMPAPKKE